MRRLAVISFVLVGLLGPGMAAQQPAPPAQRATGGYKSETVAIMVDVVVRDRRGDPVTDLGPEDFELLEDGVPQQIGSVSLYSADAAPPESAPRPAGAPKAPLVSKKLPVSPPPPPVIALVFDRNKGAIYALYTRALRDKPELQGKVVLELTISPDGEVTKCSIVSSELNDPELERKLVARVKSFRFEARDVGTITVTKPIDFFPA